MTWLIVLLSVILFFWLIGMISAKLVLVYNDCLTLYLKILFFKIGIVPKSAKKISVRKYSLKRYRKSIEKQKKKQAKKDGKKKEKQQNNKVVSKKKTSNASENKKSINDILELVNTLSAVLKKVLTSFGKHLKIKTVRLRIAVATGDAAKTAVVYGAVCQAVAYVMEMLYNITGFTVSRCGEVTVVPDFVSERSSADIKIIFKLRVWHVFAMLLSGAIAFLKKKVLNTSKDPNEEKA